MKETVQFIDVCMKPVQKDSLLYLYYWLTMIGRHFAQGLHLDLQVEPFFYDSL